MNDEAREALVAAALRGHPQAFGHMHTEAGECALGVLHLTMHEDRAQALACYGNVTLKLSEYVKWARCEHAMVRRYELTDGEYSEIVGRNDWDTQDFLTIARKVGNRE